MGGKVKHLNGKIAWVTGAGSGIGEAAAIGLARAGASVVLTGRRAAPLEDVARRIKGEGGTASAQPGDLMQASAIMASFVYNAAMRDEMLPRKPLPKPQPAPRRAPTTE